MIPVHVFRPELEPAGKPVVGRSSPLPSIVGVHWNTLTTLFVFAYLLADKLFCMAVDFGSIVFQQPRRYPNALTGQGSAAARAERGAANNRRIE